MNDLEERLDDYAHVFVSGWGVSLLIDGIARIVRTQIRRTRTLLLQS